MCPSEFGVGAYLGTVLYHGGIREAALLGLLGTGGLGGCCGFGPSVGLYHRNVFRGGNLFINRYRFRSGAIDMSFASALGGRGCYCSRVGGRKLRALRGVENQLSLA